jgi:protein-disulfide isomerase
MKIVAFVFMLLVCGTAFGQSAPGFDFRLTVVPPAPVDFLTEGQQAKLQASVLELATQQGVVMLDGVGALVLVPSLRLIDTQVVSPGMQPLTVVTAELQLTLRQADNGAVFALTTRRLRGSGRNESLAIENALRQIDPNDPALADFMNRSRQKAVAYYEQQCPALMQKAEQFRQLNEYARAFGLLLSIPASAPCAGEANRRLGVAFLAYQRQTCGRLLLEARTLLAARRFDDGLALLSQIDPLSPCANDTRQLIDKAALETANDNKQRWAVLQQAFADLRTVEQYRSQLIRDFLNRHYLTHPLYELPNARH